MPAVAGPNEIEVAAAEHPTGLSACSLSEGASCC
jgi:hypothetical protein